MPRQEYMAREILALQAAEGSRNILCTDVCAQSILTGTEIDFRLAFLDERGGSAGTRELKGLYTAYQYMKPFIESRSFRLGREGDSCERSPRV